MLVLVPRNWLSCPAFSPAFYALYIAAGASDMIDGAVARKTGTVSEFGSRLDTAADIVFVAVCLIKLLPVLHAPTWLIIWMIVIAVIKVINLICGYVARKEIVACHTVLFCSVVKVMEDVNHDAL